jgi:hypothetical protein
MIDKYVDHIYTEDIKILSNSPCHHLYGAVTCIKIASDFHVKHSILDLNIDQNMFVDTVNSLSQYFIHEQQTNGNVLPWLLRPINELGI